VGKYFKKICLKNNTNSQHIDAKVTNVNLNSETGFIQSIDLEDGRTVEGDFFIDCSGFNKILINAVGGKWVSYQKNLPLNTGLPFHLDYLPGETPEPYTTAWAQKNGWMWQIPLMDRKGCGYVFDDHFTTPEKAQEEIETILGRKIEPQRVIKFDAGRQESAWIKNCLAIGLSSAFLEPLEATSIHSTLVQGLNFVFEYLKDSVEDTVNSGSVKIYNQRTRVLYDDIKDFLVMHYMGGRNDSDFWKMISTGVTKTDYVETLLEMSKHRMPTFSDFPSYPGCASWPLYSYVMGGLNLIDKSKAMETLNMDLPIHGSLKDITTEAYYDLHAEWANEFRDCMSYDEFIKYFRELRYRDGFSNKQY
jgi:tryptophan halogenase